VEHTIGEVGHKIHSKTSPFANLSNIIVEKEVIQLIQLYYPELADRTPSPKKANSEVRVFQRLRFGSAQAASQSGEAHINTIRRLFGLQMSTPHMPNLLESPHQLQCYGKLQLASGQTLHSRASESFSATTVRCYRWFEVRSASFYFGLFLTSTQSTPSDSALNFAFGEALAFYTLRVAHGSPASTSLRTVVVYRPLTRLEQPFRTVIRGKWADEGSLLAMEVRSMRDIIGVWEAESKYVYTLRKHPSLLSLTPSERGLVDPMDSDGAIEERD
jgi:hypothetical protein